MPTTTPPLIYAKMCAIMGALDAIGKGRKNTQQNYAFRGIDDCLNALHGPLAEHGVFYTAAVRDIAQREYTTKTGTGMLHFTLTAAYTFWAADGSSVTYEAVGEASDSGDKAAGKAQAYALKVALLQVFCIPTEEQKDTEYASPERAAPTPWNDEEIAHYLGRINAAKSKIELREAWDDVPTPYRQHLKQTSIEAAARIEAATLLATNTPVV